MDTIFRRFNRVDQSDSDWLERMHYRLPSLSAGDIVVTRDLGTDGEPQAFIVAGQGFQPLRCFGPLSFLRRA